MKTIFATAVAALISTGAMACDVERVGTIYNADSPYFGQRGVVADGEFVSEATLKAAGIDMFNPAAVAFYTGCEAKFANESGGSLTRLAGDDGILGTKDDKFTENTNPSW